jgi:hypothetical protein
MVISAFLGACHSIVGIGNGARWERRRSCRSARTAITHAAKTTRTSLLGIGLLITLAACNGASESSGISTASTGTVQASAVTGHTGTPQASARTSPSALALDVGGQGPLEQGTYVTASPFLSRVTFSAPGWYASMGGPYAVFLDPSLDTASNDNGLVELVIFDKVYADPCHPDQGLLDPPPGPSADELAKALASVPSLVATTPTDVSVSGYHGKQLTLTAPKGIATCSVWELPLGATNTMVPGELDTYRIFDIDGQRLVIDAHDLPGESAAHKAEVQGLLHSIRMAPAS